jgi:hypothetical protein
VVITQDGRREGGLSLAARWFCRRAALARLANGEAGAAFFGFSFFGFLRLAVAALLAFGHDSFRYRSGFK